MPRGFYEVIHKNRLLLYSVMALLNTKLYLCWLNSQSRTARKL